MSLLTAFFKLLPTSLASAEGETVPRGTGAPRPAAMSEPSPPGMCHGAPWDFFSGVLASRRACIHGIPRPRTRRPGRFSGSPSPEARRSTFFLSLLGAFLPGCPSLPTDSDVVTDATVYELTVGTPLRDGGFAPLTESNPLELHLGFRGFIYARIVFAARGDVPDTTSGRAVFHIEGNEPVTQSLNNVTFVRRVGDVRYSSPVLLFANDVVLSSIQHRRYTLEVTLRDSRHRATARASGTVFHDTNCIDDGNGACLPRDGGTDGSGGTP